MNRPIAWEGGRPTDPGDGSATPWPARARRPCRSPGRDGMRNARRTRLRNSSHALWRSPSPPIFRRRPTGTSSRPCTASRGPRYAPAPAWGRDEASQTISHRSRTGSATGSAAAPRRTMPTPRSHRPNSISHRARRSGVGRYRRRLRGRRRTPTRRRTVPRRTARRTPPPRLLLPRPWARRGDSRSRNRPPPPVRPPTTKMT
mmetsp:Transcript_826/g.1981  ORF Transcript_826/g.1981 Transcript_826/m.1981 type:complete len:202 (-) Transcript_826:1128-1733(-)